MDLFLRHPRVAFGVILLLSWLLATGYAFWWFQVRPIQAFSDPEQTRVINFEGGLFERWLTSGGDTDGSSSNTSDTVLHFWDPECPCNRFNQVHVRNLIRNTHPDKVRFVIVVHATDQSPSGAAELRAEALAAFGERVEVLIDKGDLSRSIPSSPAAAVISAERELAYFGPYSVGAVCAPGEGDFVESVLAQLDTGNNPGFINTLGVGCFCDWPGKRAATFQSTG